MAIVAVSSRSAPQPAITATSNARHNNCIPRRYWIYQASRDGSDESTQNPVDLGAGSFAFVMPCARM
jgi:hypothetical protein